VPISQSSNLSLEYKVPPSPLPQRDLIPVDYDPAGRSVSDTNNLSLEYRKSPAPLSHGELLPLEYKPAGGTASNTRAGDSRNTQTHESISKTKKKVLRGPLRAIENTVPLPPDRSYPSSHIRDQDVEESRGAFSVRSKGGRKKPNRSGDGVSIFRPSPPISDVGKKRVSSLGKRKNTHLPTPRPTAPKITKVNRGEKRKNETQVSLKLKKKLRKDTDYDLW
jgi:hypothetical protein